MWVKKTVAAVIPAAKHKDSIFSVIQDLDSTGYVDEVIVVDNGIDLATEKQIKKTRALLLPSKGYGLGNAVNTGIRKTKADLIIVTDPQGTFSGKDVIKLLAYSDEFDIIFGTRTHVPLIHEGSGMTFTRRMVNSLFGKLISFLFLSQPLTDVRCYLRLTNKAGWRKIASECDSKSDLYLTQWLLAAAKNKIKFIEIPVNFKAPKSKENYADFFFLSKNGLLIFLYIIKAKLFDP